MDEQLVQQLAIQIDAQASQTVQSHDVQAKGGYLWNTFPQVQSCKSYNEAVLLLAREQATLQSPQAPIAPVGYPQQAQGFGVSQSAQAGFQPQSQTSIVTGAPQQGIGMTQQVQTGFGMPTPQQAPAGFGFQQPAGGFGAPPPANVFGTQGVPQTGVPAASNFTAFKPKPDKPPGKVLGFIPSKVFAIIIIAIVAAIVIGGIVVSLVNAFNPKTPAANNPPALVNPVETDDPLADFFD